MREDALGRVRFAGLVAVLPAAIAAYGWNTLVLRDVTVGAVWALLATVFAKRRALRLELPPAPLTGTPPLLVVGLWPLLAVGLMTAYLIPFAGPTTRITSICAWVVTMMLPSAAYNATLAAGVSPHGRDEHLRRILTTTGCGFALALAASIAAFAARPTVPAVFAAQGARTALVPSLDSVAAQATGRPVGVYCFSPSAWAALEQRLGDSNVAGYAPYQRQAVELAPEVCDVLLGLQRGRFRPSERYPNDRRVAAAAVGTLAHEFEHVEGVKDEAVAECYGLQSLAAVAQMLGASRQYASDLARVYWLDLYPRNEPSYRTPACRPGGPLDLPGPWP